MTRVMKVMGVALALSVCVNFFLAGAWLTQTWAERRLQSSVAAGMKTYPPVVRREVARRVFANREEFRAVVTDLRDARQRMFDAMRADPLDPPALAAAMADVRARTAAAQALLQDALSAALQDLPAADRAKIAPAAVDATIVESP